MSSKTFEDFREVVVKENGFSSWNDFKDKVEARSISTIDYLEAIQDAADRYCLHLIKNDNKNFNTEIPKSL